MTGRTDLGWLEALIGRDLARELPGTRPDLDEAAPADDVLGALAALARPAAPPAGLLDAVEAAIDRPAATEIRILRAGDGRWSRRADKIWRKVISKDPKTGRTISLVRCAPGAVLPTHTHEREEIVVMLEGEYRSPDGIVRAGDVQICPAGSHHLASVTPAGCLLLVVR